MTRQFEPFCLLLQSQLQAWRYLERYFMCVKNTDILHWCRMAMTGQNEPFCLVFKMILQ